MYSASVEKLASEFKLKNNLPEISLEGRTIKNSAVNRPALQLAGFFDFRYGKYHYGNDAPGMP